MRYAEDVSIFDFSDHIAIPDQTWAMENWGLITYGEAYLCVDKEVSAIDGIVNVASIIAHEVAHQVRLSTMGIFVAVLPMYVFEPRSLE